MREGLGFVKGRNNIIESYKVYCNIEGIYIIFNSFIRGNYVCIIFSDT